MQIRRLFTTLLCCCSTAAIANPQLIIAPDCLISGIQQHFKILTQQDHLNLIEVSEQQLQSLSANNRQSGEICGRFLNVTHEWQAYQTQQQPNIEDFFQKAIAIPASSFPQKNLQFEKEVTLALQAINPQNMWDNLTTLSNFPDRYANSKHGIEAIDWMKQQVEKIKESFNRDDISLSFIDTKGYKQPSLVVKIGQSNEPGVVISAHIDTLASTFSKKPGADDDGSGSVTILEAFRSLMSSQLHFKNPIYFIWYAAEEEGLVGSSVVVRDFKAKNIPIAGVLHFDLTGFAYQNDQTLWLITDFVNPELTQYLDNIITTYVKVPTSKTRCGYACSDHASWTKQGVPAAIPAEAAYEHTNPNIHSSRDTMEKLSLTHMTNYAKTAVAFAVEMAEPTSSH